MNMSKKTINTKTIDTRFGTLTVKPESCLRCISPILGFEDLSQFVLVDIEQYRPFIWLQSLEEPTLSFLLADPNLFGFSYRKETLASQHQRDSDNLFLLSMVIFNHNDTRPHKYGPIWIDTQERVFGQWVVDNGVVNEEASDHAAATIPNHSSLHLPCLVG